MQKKILSRPLLEASRRLRRDATPTEQKLWACLRNRKLKGAKFRRQAVIGRFIVDFYCHESRLIVELDGAVHGRPDMQAHDAERQALLEAQGCCVLRFRNDEVEDDLSSVLEKIGKHLLRQQASDNDSPSPCGRGG